MSIPLEDQAQALRPMLVSYLRALVGDSHLAEDLAQETLLTAHRRRDDFDATRPLAAWLRGIAHNKALQESRAKARRPVIADSAIVSGIEEVFSLFDESTQPWDARHQALRACVASLQPSSRDLVHAVYSDGDSIQEAATRFEIGFSAAAKRLSRAREVLRRCLQHRIQDTSSKETNHASTR